MAQVVFLHGFTHEQVIAVMRAAKKAIAESGGDPAEVAFAMSTPTNQEWKVSRLIADVSEDHEYLKKNPPKR